MYVDKLDGLVDAAFFERMSNQWREAQNSCLREIQRHQQADKSYMDEGVQLLELARKDHNWSHSSSRTKNAACSTSYYRTALGRMARWSPRFANRLIF